MFWQGRSEIGNKQYFFLGLTVKSPGDWQIITWFKAFDDQIGPKYVTKTDGWLPPFIDQVLTGVGYHTSENEMKWIGL